MYNELLEQALWLLGQEDKPADDNYRSKRKQFELNLADYITHGDLSKLTADQVWNVCRWMGKYRSYRSLPFHSFFIQTTRYATYDK